MRGDRVSPPACRQPKPDSHQSALTHLMTKRGAGTLVRVVPLGADGGFSSASRVLMSAVSQLSPASFSGGTDESSAVVIALERCVPLEAQIWSASFSVWTCELSSRNLQNAF